MSKGDNNIYTADEAPSDLIDKVVLEAHAPSVEQSLIRQNQAETTPQKLGTFR